MRFYFFDWAKRTRTMSQGSTTSRFDQCNAVKSSRLPHSRRASAVRGNPCVPTKNINRNAVLFFWSGQSGREPCPRVRQQVDLTSVTQSNRHGCPTAGAPAPCEGIPVSPPKKPADSRGIFVYLASVWPDNSARPNN